MIDHSPALRMVEPRAEVELREKICYAKCLKCGKIIADSTDELTVTGLKPEDVKSTRIKCRNCGKMNFVSHV